MTRKILLVSQTRSIAAISIGLALVVCLFSFTDDSLAKGVRKISNAARQLYQ